MDEMVDRDKFSQRRFEIDNDTDMRQKHCQGETTGVLPEQDYQMDRDADSVFSDLNTIDEFFHESAVHDIQSMHDRDVTQPARTKLKSGEIMNSLDQEIMRLDQTLKDIATEEQKKEPLCDDRQIKGAFNYDGSQNKRTSRYQSSVEPMKRDTYKERYSREAERDIRFDLRRIRDQQEELSIRSSRYEKESLKLRKLQLEEAKRKQLIIEDEKMLKYELDMKRRADAELVKRIEQIEIQESDLDRRRNENERLQKDVSELRREDDDLTKKLKLLKEKETLLLEKSKLQRDGQNQTEEFDQVKATDRNKAKEKDHKDRYPLFKVGLPSIPLFDGKHFEQWKTEVICLIEANVYPDYAIAQAARNSLKGDTRQVLLTLKPTSTTEEIVKKLKEIYGNVKSADKIIHEFYSAKQKHGESCSAWGVRLETLFQQALEKGEIVEKRRDKKLKERFWRELTSERLKMATRVSYESEDSFEVLRRKARSEEEEESIEKDFEVTKQNLTNVSQQTNKEEKDDILKDILERIKSIETDLGNMKNQKEYSTTRDTWHPRGRGAFGGYRGNRQRPRQDQRYQVQSDSNWKKGDSKEKPLN